MPRQHNGSNPSPESSSQSRTTTPSTLADVAQKTDEASRILVEFIGNYSKDHAVSRQTVNGLRSEICTLNKEVHKLGQSAPAPPAAVKRLGRADARAHIEQSIFRLDLLDPEWTSVCAVITTHKKDLTKAALVIFVRRLMKDELPQGDIASKRAAEFIVSAAIVNNFVSSEDKALFEDKAEGGGREQILAIWLEDDKISKELVSFLNAVRGEMVSLTSPNGIRFHLNHEYQLDLMGPLRRSADHPTTPCVEACLEAFHMEVNDDIMPPNDLGLKVFPKLLFDLVEDPDQVAAGVQDPTLHLCYPCPEMYRAVTAWLAALGITRPPSAALFAFTNMQCMSLEIVQTNINRRNEDALRQSPDVNDWRESMDKWINFMACPQRCPSDDSSVKALQASKDYAQPIPKPPKPAKGKKAKTVFVLPANTDSDSD